MPFVYFGSVLLVSGSPIPAWAQVWADAEGRWNATFACKATFSLRPGRLVLADEQPEVGEGRTATVELVPFKARVDVLLVGDAYVPVDHGASQLVARVRVGTIDKRAAVAPSAEGRARPIHDFGPVPAAERSAAAGLSWAIEAWRDQTLPADLDPAVFNAAPPDQQLSELPADEPLILEHLHPSYERLEMQLPGTTPAVYVDRAGAPLEPVAVRIDTLYIDTSRGLCSICWRGRIPLREREEQARAVVFFEAVEHNPATLTIPAAWANAIAPVDETVAFSGDEHPPGIPESMGLPFSSSRPRADTASVVLSVGNASPMPPFRPTSTAAPSPWGGAVSSRVSGPLPEWVKTKGAAEPLAAEKGLLAASDAARRSRAEWTDQAAQSGRGEPHPLFADRRPTRLVWFDASSFPQLRKRFRRIVTEHDLRPIAPGDLLDGDADDPAWLERSRTHDILVRAPLSSLADLHHALHEAVQAGRFEPPCAVVEGELTLPFDEVESLRAVITAVTPFVAGDRKLEELVVAAKELLGLDYLEGAGDLAAQLADNIRKRFASATKVMTRQQLDSHVERMLLERRKHQKRSFGGKTWVRGLLQITAPEPSVVCYLDEGLVAELPLFGALSVRFIVEVDERQDERERADIALKVRAVGLLSGSRLAQR